MFPELTALRHLAAALYGRLQTLQHSDDGYSTEAVIVTALLVALALTAVGIIAAKVIGKANSINTGP